MSFRKMVRVYESIKIFQEHLWCKKRDFLLFQGKIIFAWNNKSDIDQPSHFKNVYQDR